MYVAAFVPGRGGPLILHHEIVAAPSASTLTLLRGEASKRTAAPKVLAVFGDDVWATGYEHEVRVSGTTFIFEGPGKDPFLVLDPSLTNAAA